LDKNLNIKNVILRKKIDKPKEINDFEVDELVRMYTQRVYLSLFLGEEGGA
jgi:hypothetical protein